MMIAINIATQKVAYPIFHNACNPEIIPLTIPPFLKPT
jgi:hypothetical protein